MKISCVFQEIHHSAFNLKIVNFFCSIYNFFANVLFDCYLIKHFALLLWVFFKSDTTLLFLLDNSTLSYMTLEEEEVVMEIILGTSFVHSDLEIAWFRNNLLVRNSSRIRVTVEREERAFRLYTTRLYVTSARTDDGNGTSPNYWPKSGFFTEQKKS